MFGTDLYIGQENLKGNLWLTVCVLHTFSHFSPETHQAIYIEMIMHVIAVVRLLTDINSCVRIVTLSLSN